MGTNDFPAVTDMEGWMREVEKRILRQERRGGVTNGVITGEGLPVRAAPILTGGVPAASTDGAPPQESTTPTVAPLGYGGVTIKWTAIDNPDTVGYRVYFDTINPPQEVLTETGGLAVATSVLADGTTKLVPGITYYAQIETYDADGVGIKGGVGSGGPIVVPSDAVSEDILVVNQLFSREGYFGTISAENITSGFVDAVLALRAGAVEVGTMSLRPARPPSGDDPGDPGGLHIPLPNGGEIRLPADPTTMAKLLGVALRATSISIDDLLTINGLRNTLAGGLVLTAGTPDPRTAPEVTSEWNSIYSEAQQIVVTPSDRYMVYSMSGGALTWSEADQVFYGLRAYSVTGSTMSAFRWEIYSVTAEGVSTTLHEFGVSKRVYGAQKVGNLWYVLTTNPSTSTGYAVEAYDPSASWSRVGNVSVLTDAQIGRNGQPDSPVCTYDGTYFYIANRMTGNTLHVARFTVNEDPGVAAGPINPTSATITTGNGGLGGSVTGIWVGDADFPSSRVVLCQANQATPYSPVWGGTMTYAATERFFAPTGSNLVSVTWDGERFIAEAPVNMNQMILWRYSKIVTAVNNQTFAYDYFDNVGTPHSSLPSPQTTVAKIAARSWVIVRVTDPVPEPTTTDKPNRYSIYAGGFKQTDVSVGVDRVLLDNLITGTSGPSETNTFSNAVGAGFWASMAADDDGEILRANGDGTARFGDIYIGANGRAGVHQEVATGSIGNNALITTEVMRLATGPFVARTGVRYRVYGKCSPSNNTVGAYTRAKLVYSVTAGGTAGTLLDNAALDHTTQDRTGSLILMADFTWTGDDKTTLYVKMLMSGNGGTTTDRGLTHMPTRIWVDQIT